MLLQFSLFHFFFFFLLLTPTLTSAGCPQKCGNLQIQYPFGVGSNCSMDPSFNIICNKSTNPPKAYLNITNGRLLELVEINLNQIRVKYPYMLAATCYNNSSVYPHNITRDDYYSIDLTATQYSLSDQNWLTTLGCDDIVVGFALSNQSFAGGCVSYCSKNESDGFGVCPNSENGHSAGNGCCRTPLPKGITFLVAQMNDLSGKWLRNKFFPCSYAFVEEKQILNQSMFQYPFSELSKPLVSQDDNWILTSTPPVVRLDWRVRAENCSEAQRNHTTYACKENSNCLDFEANDSVRGYLCRCKKGYEGNPYSNEGCRDVNECADGLTNPCDSNSICKNIPGSFSCSCRYGYYGDGRKDGKGCILVYKIIIMIGVGCGFVLLLLQAMFFRLHKVLQKRKNRKRKEDLFKHLLLQQANEGTFERTKLFPAKELQKATDHFNESRILGKGGQGTVYKGMLYDGTIVAIKKLKQVDENQIEQFVNEIVILTQIMHKNVVRLLGCCLETEVPLLVFEFLPNGTLFDLIHGSNVEFPVSWNMRLKIAADIAGALAYLHSALSIPIYHRDIKSSNFLLDGKYVVKVADFGISSLVKVDKTHITTMVKGTFGYFDPEYFQSHQYTEKSEVFSFGVVLAELLTGRKPIFRENSEEVEIALATHFLTSMEENNFDVILDPQVSEHTRKEEVIAVARLAEKCLNRERKNRPTMKEVSAELECLRIHQMPAKAKEESEDATEYEANPMMISDIQYIWTTGCTSETSTTSSDIHPLMYETV